MKHTPAPWRFDQEEMKIKGTEDANFHTVIANVSPKMPYSRGMGTQCANARLIAAAPELLEALQMMVQRFENCDKGMIKAEYVKNKAKSAIQKATQP